MLGEVSGQPSHCCTWLPQNPPQVEIRTVLNGCWVKALSCRAGGSGVTGSGVSMALIHHSRFQGRLHQILGGAFFFFSSVCRGALEKEVAIEGFNGRH